MLVKNTCARTSGGRSTLRRVTKFRRANVTNCSALSNASTERSTFKGSSDYKFAPLINGCWQFAGGHGREVFDDLPKKLRAHAEAGLTTFDTADIYGPSEQLLGDFQAAWASEGKPPVQIFTKFVPNIFREKVTPGMVDASIKRSLSALKVRQLDLVQMHWWDYSIPGMVDAALALAELQAKGLIRFVGTTNMSTEALAKIVDAGVPVVANQVQFSLIDRRPLAAMVPYCSDRGIKIFSYGSVAGGLLSDKYVEEPKTDLLGRSRYSNVALNTSSLKMYWNMVDQAGGQGYWRALLRTLRGVADKHQVSVSALSLAWLRQQGAPGTVVPLVGLRSAEHIQDNLSALSVKLDGDDLAAINAAVAEAQGPLGDCYALERGR